MYYLILSKCFLQKDTFPFVHDVLVLLLQFQDLPLKRLVLIFQLLYRLLLLLTHSEERIYTQILRHIAIAHLQHRFRQKTLSCIP